MLFWVKTQILLHSLCYTYITVQIVLYTSPWSLASHTTNKIWTELWLNFGNSHFLFSSRANDISPSLHVWIQKCRSFILAAHVRDVISPVYFFAKTTSSCLTTPIAHTVCAAWAPTQLLKTWEYQISTLTSVQRTADALCKSGACIFWDLNLFVLKRIAGSKVSCQIILEKLLAFYDFCQHPTVCSQKDCVSITVGPELSQKCPHIKKEKSLLAET